MQAYVSSYFTLSRCYENNQFNKNVILFNTDNGINYSSLTIF